MVGLVHSLLDNRCWNLQTEPVLLEKDDVHVWFACLNQTESQVKRLARVIGKEEQKRADRYYFEKDRQRFIVCRAVLRVLLGRYLKREPRELSFFYGCHGKPYLAAGGGNSTLCFNVAHSYGLAAYAFTWNRAIGVDIELVRSDLAFKRIAECFFSPRELAKLRDLPEDIQPLAFFNCWTRKEAYLKALGDGLTRPLHHVEVSLAPGEPTKLLHVEGSPQEVLRWSLHTLDPEPGYIGTLAVYGHTWRLARLERAEIIGQ